MKDAITEFFFFSEEDLRDFHYDTHKFGGLPFFLELAVFLAVKLGVDNPKRCISFFRMYRKFLVGNEGLIADDGHKYSASGMINFLLFVRLCPFKTQEDGLEFLEKHKGWVTALGFTNGVPRESDVTKFVSKIGVDLDVYFVQLLRFIRENVSIEGKKGFYILGFLRHNIRSGVIIRAGSGTKFTSYSRGKKRASTHWAGMTLILDALYALGIIKMIGNIPAKTAQRFD